MTTVQSAAIAAHWPGPKELAAIVDAYAMLTVEEDALIHLLSLRVNNDADFCGVLVRWDRRQNANGWLERRYTVSIKGSTSRLVTFDQLLLNPVRGQSWLDSIRAPRGSVVAAYEHYRAQLAEYVSFTREQRARDRALQARRSTIKLYLIMMIPPLQQRNELMLSHRSAER